MWKWTRRVILAELIFLLLVSVYAYQRYAEASPSGAFHIFTNWYDVSYNSTAGTWTDVDVSSYVPYGASGVVLDVYNANASYAYQFDLRRKGSADSVLSYGNLLFANRRTGFMVGLDTDRVFQAYEDVETGGPPSDFSVQIKIMLIGYTGDDVVFFTNKINISPTPGSWQTIDITSQVDTINPSDTATGAIMKVAWDQAGAGGCQCIDFDVRKYGSAQSYLGENLIQDAYGGQIEGAWTGVDANERLQARTADADTKLYLIGYTKGTAVTWETTYVDISISGTGAWTDKDLDGSPPIVPAGTHSVLLLGWESVYTGTGGYLYTRENGSSNGFPGGAMIGMYDRTRWFASGIDSSYILEEYITHLNINLYIVAYDTSEPGISPGTTTTTLSSTTTTIMPSGFDLGGVCSGVGDALGINDEAGCLLLSFILFFMVLVPLGMLTKNPIVLLIAGLTFAGFLVAVSWLPVWIMIMLSLIVALLFAGKLTTLVSRGGSGESD